MWNFKFFVSSFFLGIVFVFAQCDFDPTVEGDLLFCPNQSEGTLSTNFDNAEMYQWYRRLYGEENAVPIDGATSQSISVSSDDILTYFSVEVTINDCTERSPEEILDQRIFLYPTVAASGDYMSSASGFLICEGDSMTFTLQSPYNTNITWYMDGNPIANENGNTLVVTAPGEYTVSGAVGICPDDIQPLGISFNVSYNTDPEACDLGVSNSTHTDAFKVYPNPVNNILQIDAARSSIETIHIRNSLGQVVFETKLDAVQTSIDVTNFLKGVYYVELTINGTPYTHKIIKN